MQRKLAEHKGNDVSITAPDISDHISGRKVSDWTGDLGEVDNMMQGDEEEFIVSSHPNCGAQSHQGAVDKNADEDSLMSEERREQQHEIHSQAAPQSA